jgi:hypothetical protein
MCLKVFEMKELAAKINIELGAMRLWYKKKQQNVQSCLKKFKTSNIAPSVALNLLVTNSSVPDNDNSVMSNPTSSPFVHISSIATRPTQNKCIAQLSSNANANVTTPVKQIASALTADQIHHAFFKGQTPHASSFSLSSPSAAILFGMNSNSFSVPNEVQYNANAASSRTQTTTVTKTFVDQHDKENKPSNHNLSFTNNTSISNIDDVIIETFMNDISYELMQK